MRAPAAGIPGTPTMCPLAGDSCCGLAAQHRERSRRPNDGPRGTRRLNDLAKGNP